MFWSDEFALVAFCREIDSTVLNLDTHKDARFKKINYRLLNLIFFVKILYFLRTKFIEMMRSVYWFNYLVNQICTALQQYYWQFHHISKDPFDELRGVWKMWLNVVQCYTQIYVKLFFHLFQSVVSVTLGSLQFVTSWLWFLYLKMNVVRIKVLASFSFVLFQIWEET